MTKNEKIQRLKNIDFSIPHYVYDNVAQVVPEIADINGKGGYEIVSGVKLGEADRHVAEILTDSSLPKVSAFLMVYLRPKFEISQEEIETAKKIRSLLLLKVALAG